MARGRPWTLEEDDLIRQVASENYRPGGYTADVPEDDKPWDRRMPAGREYARRLAAVAEKIGRSREAVCKHAQRLGARSKQPAYFGKARKP